MADLRDLKDKAAEHARKGRWAKAAEALGAVVAADPRDLATKQKLADALRRSGAAADALRIYAAVADAYATQGELIKAIAVCKVILDLEPTHGATQAALADLYARRQAEGPRGVAMTPGRPRRAEPAAPAPEPERELVLEPLAGGDEPSETPGPDGQPSWLERGTTPEVLVPPPPEVAAARAEALGAVTGDLVDATSEHALADAPRSTGQDELPLEMIVEPEEEEPAPPPGPAALPHVPLFSGLSREAFLALAAKLARVEVRAGDAVLREGERGRSLFVVASGRVRVEKARPGAGPIVLARVGEGGFFGEMALLSGDPRMASVVAEEDAVLLEIAGDALASLCRLHPTVAASLGRFYRERLLANAMATSALFAPFSADDRATLVRRFEPRTVAAGEILIREGERSDGLFVAVSGRYEVVRKGGGDAVKVATLREGDLFGEMSCLRRQAAAASVVSARRGIVLRLARERFAEVASSYPQVLELVAGLAEERQQSLDALATKRNQGPYYV